MDAENWGKDAPLEVAKIQKDLLWNEYSELRNHARHSENVRTNAISFVLLLTTALTAIVTLDKKIDGADLAPALIIAVLGFFSIPFSLLFLERYERNKKRASMIRRELDRIFFDGKGLSDGLSNLRKASDERHVHVANEHALRTVRVVARWVTRLRGTHFFWIVMPVFVFVAGTVLTVLAVAARA